MANPAVASETTPAAPVVEAAVAPAPDAAPAVAPAETPKAEPSLLAAADSAKAKEPADTKPEVKPEAAADAKPADGKEPAKDAKSDAKETPEKPVQEASKDAKPAADAAADAKPDGKEPAKEAAVEKPPAHVYEAFKVPDGTKLDDERVSAFTGILENPELDYQGRGQALMDMHIAELQRVSNQISQNQREVWTAYQTRQKDEIRNDPDVGGNRIETTLGRAKAMIEEFGGTDQQVASTLEALSYTGMGNNVGLVRVLNKVWEMLSEGTYVPPNQPSARTPTTVAERWYGDNGKGART